MKLAKDKRAKPYGEKSIFVFALRYGIVFMIILLFFYAVTMISGFEPFYNDSADKNSLTELRGDADDTNLLIDAHYGNLYEITARLSKVTDKAGVDAILAEYIGADHFGDLRYFSHGSVYSAAGLEVTDGMAEELMMLSGSSQICSSSVFRDELADLDCIAFYVPIKGSQFVDGLASIVPARNLINMNSVLNEDGEFVALVSSSGMILADARREDFGQTLGNSIFDYLRGATKNETSVIDFTVALGSKSYKTVQITIDGIAYTVAVAPLSSSSNNLSVVCLFNNEKVTEVELTYLRQVMMVLIIAVLSLLISVIYSVLYHKKSVEAIKNANITDMTLECPNIEAFRRTAVLFNTQTDQKRFAVVSYCIRQFIYIKDSLGEQKTNEILKFCAQVFSKFISPNETYGYAGDGRFLVMYHSNSETYVKEKILLSQALINKCDIVIAEKLNIKFDVGICFTAAPGSKRHTIAEAMDCALIAQGHAATNINLPYVIYTDEVSAEITKNEKIESQMEAALKNGDFKLFMQPKYNVLRDCIDSAEALVRWFDPKKGDYIFPGEFINVFETNGFIVKLDHFVYLEVLKYMRDAAEHEQKLVPIAVNVSRVTASSPDFVEFYISNKKKYGIGDGFITIEFTESYAMEDYAKISDIVDRLHSNGIKVSIDDFGSGYSSFNILKNIQTDELKLDRFFLMPGLSKERDDYLSGIMIDLAKKMNMTVVQEGVENEEMFSRIVSMGVDVVQGYYYAKPIPLEEYRIFLNTNTSIKYKSKVK